MSHIFKIFIFFEVLTAGHAYFDAFFTALGIGNNTSCGISQCLNFSKTDAGLFPFSILCAIPDPLGIINKVCASDCQCTHGAPSGGVCGPSPDLSGAAACICNYTSSTSMSAFLDILGIASTTLCQEFNASPGRLLEFCGSGFQGVDGNLLCQNDCGCFHGANGTCETQHLLTGNYSYCKCNY